MPGYINNSTTTPQEALELYRSQANAEDKRQVALLDKMSLRDRFELLMYMMFFTNELLGHVYDIVCSVIEEEPPSNSGVH